MKNMKPTNEILNEIFLERNSSPNTQKSYQRAVNTFELYFNKQLGEILTIAETEEDQLFHPPLTEEWSVWRSIRYTLDRTSTIDIGNLEALYSWKELGEIEPYTEEELKGCEEDWLDIFEDNDD